MLNMVEISLNGSKHERKKQHKNKLNNVTNFSNSIAVARPTFAADGKLAIRWDPINWLNPATCL
jgi:hypothetical protein